MIQDNQLHFWPALRFITFWAIGRTVLITVFVHYIVPSENVDRTFPWAMVPVGLAIFMALGYFTFYWTAKLHHETLTDVRGEEYLSLYRKALEKEGIGKMLRRDWFKEKFDALPDR